MISEQQVRFSALLAVMIGVAGQAKADPMEPVGVPDRFWLREAARQRREFAAGQFRVCFLGDSLTAFWKTQGQGAWELDLKPFKPMNAGIAGDRVENIHFRVRHRDFVSDPAPEVFVVLAGTNNLGKNPPDDPGAVASGVLALVKTVQRKWPQAKVLLLSIPPSGYEPGSELRKRIAATNRELASKAESAGADWLDLHDRFLDETGNWRPGLTVDGTHLTSRGYDVLAGPVREKLAGWLGEKHESNHPAVHFGRERPVFKACGVAEVVRPPKSVCPGPAA